MPIPRPPSAIVRDFLRSTNIPQEFFAGVTGLSTGALSLFLNDKRSLPFAEEQKCLSAAKVIRLLIDRMAPIPINFHPRCVEVFKKILSDFEKRLLLVSVISLNVGTTASDDVAKTAVHLDKLMVGNISAGLEALAGKKSEEIQNVAEHTDAA